MTTIVKHADRPAWAWFYSRAMWYRHHAEDLRCYLNHSTDRIQRQKNVLTKVGVHWNAETDQYIKDGKIL
jgi:hypothetical protein